MGKPVHWAQSVQSPLEVESNNGSEVGQFMRGRERENEAQKPDERQRQAEKEGTYLLSDVERRKSGVEGHTAEKTQHTRQVSCVQSNNMEIIIIIIIGN